MDDLYAYIVFEKVGAMPAWKKQFRRALDAFTNDTHVWHGVGTQDPHALASILTNKQVQNAHRRPDVDTGGVFLKAPHEGAFFSTRQPVPTYWDAGGVGVPKQAVPGTLVYRQPQADHGHEWLSKGPVNLPARSFAIPGYSGSQQEDAAFRQLTQHAKARPIHPTALAFAESAMERGTTNTDVHRLERGVLDALKADRQGR